MSNTTQVLLSNGSWLVGGTIVSSVYWRWFYHRILVSEGAKREPPLSLFVAIIVALASMLSFLYSAQLTSCVNDVLGDRQSVSDTPAIIELANADSSFAIAIADLLAHPPAKDPESQQAAAVAFGRVVGSYAEHTGHAVHTLQANIAYRAAHPLGKC